MSSFALSLSDLSVGMPGLTSAILCGTPAQLTKRVQQKLIQVEPTDHVCPSIIGIVEFSGPRIHLEGE